MAARRLVPCSLALVLILHASFLRAEDGDGGPVRIISLYAAHTEVLLRLGARDNIIGVSRQESYAGPETRGWHPPEYSFRDDVEKFLAARPDVVLVRPQHVAGGRHMRDALERAGIRVVALQVTRAADLAGYWRDLGAMVGREAEAEIMIARFEREVARYRRAAAARRDKPGVFLEAIHREVKTFTPESLPVWLVELAGGRNVADDARPATPGVIIAEYGPERLMARAAGVDILVSQQGHMNTVSRETLLSRTLYRAMPAVRNGRVFRIPEALLARPTPSLLDGLALLAGWTGLEVSEE